MNVGILSPIRRAGERLRPYIKRQKLLHPFREIVMNKLRIFAPLTQIPLVLSKEIRFFLPSYPTPNSKAAAVFYELCAAGISRSMIWIPGPSDHYTVTSFVRLLCRLPQALVFLFIVVRRAPCLDCIDLQIILGREFFRHFLHRHPMVSPIIISDVSPGLHMLWSAAMAAGFGAIWWQEDYHHIESLPYSIAAAAVLNQGGYEAVLHSSPSAVIVRRPSIPLNPIRQIPDYPRVGIATNNAFIASQNQKDLLRKICHVFCISEIYVRLHPNSKIVSTDFPEDWITIAPDVEPLKQFASKIDIAVVGNSAVQLRLLFEGVPVMHVPDLDPNGYDLYGYCQRGFIFGADNFDADLLPDISNYYNNPRLKATIADYVGVRVDICLEGLSGLSRLIDQIEN